MLKQDRASCTDKRKREKGHCEERKKVKKTITEKRIIKKTPGPGKLCSHPGVRRTDI